MKVAIVSYHDEYISQVLCVRIVDFLPSLY